MEFESGNSATLPRRGLAVPGSSPSRKRARSGMSSSMAFPSFALLVLLSLSLPVGGFEEGDEAADGGCAQLVIQVLINHTC